MQRPQIEMRLRYYDKFMTMSVLRLGRGPALLLLLVSYFWPFIVARSRYKVRAFIDFVTMLQEAEACCAAYKT